MGDIMERQAGAAGGETVGRVSDLWRYPVKSMRGERCAALELEARGIAGDRLYAVRDAAGKFGSGKNTRRFCRIDGLLRFAARFGERGLAVEFPDGRLVAEDDPALPPALSATLGQPLELVREAAVSHLDAGPVHLLTTAALDWLARRLPGAAADARRFRPNLVIEAPGSALIEHAWPGRVLGVGPTARLLVTGLAERCVMVDLAQGDLPRDGRILRKLAGGAPRGAPVAFGVYARVLVAGPLRVGDHVALLGQSD